RLVGATRALGACFVALPASMLLGQLAQRATAADGIGCATVMLTMLVERVRQLFVHVGGHVKGDPILLKQHSGTSPSACLDPRSSASLRRAYPSSRARQEL